MTTIKNNNDESLLSHSVINRPPAEKHGLPDANVPAIAIPSAPVAAAAAQAGSKTGTGVGTSPHASVWSDPAVVVGIALFVGKICRRTAVPFPKTLLSLLHRHADQRDLACKLAIVWLKKNAVIADLLPPYRVKGQTDA